MKKTLGIIGLGAMGYPIAQHLIQHGFQMYTVTRSDRSRIKAAELGIHVLDSYHKMADYTDRVLILVSNFTQCTDCLLGENGVLSTLRTGMIILSSTVSPDNAAYLAEKCPDGVQLIDAPISGGSVGARNGTLLIMAAGNADAVESCNDIFECYGKKVAYIGPKAGQAQAVKAVNQMLVAIHMTATAEAFALSDALGIDPNAMFETISDCAGNSFIFQSRMPKLIQSDFSVRASLETLEKDTGICMELANNANVPCYLTALCHDLFSQTPRTEAFTEDACAVIRMYQK